MATIDLLLDLDDELYAELERQARLESLTLEELLGRRISRAADLSYTAPSHYEGSSVKPTIHLDLRTR